MVFDLTATSFVVFFDGNLSGLDAYYRLRLISKYNNDEILNSVDTGDGEQFDLTLVTSNARYTEFSVDFANNDIINKDIEGYYTWIVENGPDQDLGPWTEIKRGLCKIHNLSEQSESNKTVQYASNDESNQPYVYYK